jgi:excisionase family DNA binding protein
MEYKIKNEFEQRPLIFDNRIGIGKRFLSVKNLAVFLDVSEHTVRKWVEKGSIPFVRIRDSNTIRFDVFEIVKWVNPTK